MRRYDASGAITRERMRPRSTKTSSGNAALQRLFPTVRAVHLNTASGSTKLVLAAHGRSAIRLQQNGHIDDNEDAILVYSAEKPPPMTRSPRSSPGRTGVLGLREVSIYDLLKTATSSEDLMRQFRLEAAI